MVKHQVMYLPKFGDFALSLESIAEIYRLCNEFSILELCLGGFVFVLRDDVLISVLHPGAVDTERSGYSRCSYYGFHWRTEEVVAEEREGW